jgi:hypothetical protein
VSSSRAMTRRMLVDLAMSAAARLVVLVLMFVSLYVTFVLAAEPRIRHEARWFRGASVSRPARAGRLSNLLARCKSFPYTRFVSSGAKLTRRHYGVDALAPMSSMKHVSTTAPPARRHCHPVVGGGMSPSRGLRRTSIAGIGRLVGGNGDG